MLYHIFASTSDLLIGVDKQLPWHYPEDLKYFKTKTFNKVVVMGRKTFESLGCKPLPNRTNVVISTTMESTEYPNVIVLNSPNLVLEWAKTADVFVIGGTELFKLFPSPDCIFQTVVPGADKAKVEKATSLYYYPEELLTGYTEVKSVIVNDLNFKELKK